MMTTIRTLEPTSIILQERYMYVNVRNLHSYEDQFPIGA